MLQMVMWLEIIIVAVLFRKLSVIVRKKNRNRCLPLILPLLSFAGWVFTPHLGAYFHYYMYMGKPMDDAVIIACAFGGATLGAIIAFWIVSRLPSR